MTQEKTLEGMDSYKLYLFLRIGIWISMSFSSRSLLRKLMGFDEDGRDFASLLAEFLGARKSALEDDEDLCNHAGRCGWMNTRE